MSVVDLGVSISLLGVSVVDLGVSISLLGVSVVDLGVDVSLLGMSVVVAPTAVAAAAPPSNNFGFTFFKFLFAKSNILPNLPLGFAFLVFAASRPSGPSIDEARSGVITSIAVDNPIRAGTALIKPLNPPFLNTLNAAARPPNAATPPPISPTVSNKLPSLPPALPDDIPKPPAPVACIALSCAFSISSVFFLSLLNSLASSISREVGFPSLSFIHCKRSLISSKYA